MSKFNLEAYQKAIAREGLDGWLLYDFQGSDIIARRLLNISDKLHLSRRWFYFIPVTGTPKKLSHKIEPDSLAHLPGERKLFASWKDLDEGLKWALGSSKRVAMNYSPRNSIPYVSRVDAGTVELVRSVGVDVISAKDLIQQFEAVWTAAQLETHVRAAKALRSIVDETFAHVGELLGSGKKPTEYEIQQYIVGRYGHYNLWSDTDPIVAVGSHSGNPHYGPEPTGSSVIKKDDFLLIDIWARETPEDGVYADITWTGFLGPKVPEKNEKIFQIVRGGRDAALKLVEETIRAGKPLQGADVDDAARNYIAAAGYGEYFIHRTGHNIGRNVHGNGANMDNFETKEERKVLPRTCFSIEPGIYMSDFGVRSEIDVYVTDNDVTVYGQPIQTSVVPIMR